MRHKKIIILVIIHALFLQQSYAQHMQMNNNTSVGKNIFLEMMDTMMIKMDHVPDPESVESDFLCQMIPHHEGAVTMADYEIAHGINTEMIQLAKSIKAEQTSEIQQMRLWLIGRANYKTSIPKEYPNSMNKTMMSMMDHMPASGELPDVDRAFARVMIPHHQAAVDMAKVIINYSSDHQTIAFANSIISSERIEIEQMNNFINK